MRSTGTVLTIVALFTLTALVGLTAYVDQQNRSSVSDRAEFDRKRLASPSTGKIPAQVRQRELEYAKTLPTREALALEAGKSAAVTWERRGPANLGGRTRAIAYDLTNGTTILAATASGGIWRSTNTGQIWVKTTAPADLHSTSSIVQDTSGGTLTWYAGTGELLGNTASGGGSASYRGDGIFRSTDGGVTWTQVQFNNIPQAFESVWDYVWDLAVDQSNATQDELYVATFGGIFRSVNGGTTASLELGGVISSSAATDVVANPAGWVFASLSSEGMDAGIHRSFDGQSWTDVTPAALPANYGRIELGLTEGFNASRLWALAYTPGTGATEHMLLEYDAWTDSWTDYTSLIPNRGGATGTFSSDQGATMVVAPHPIDTTIVFVGGENLFRIDTDAGTDTWIGGYDYANANSHDEYPGHRQGQHGVAFRPSNPDQTITANEGGLFWTSDNSVAGDGGVDWFSLNDRYYTSTFNKVCFNSNDADPFIAGSATGLGVFGTIASAPTAVWNEELVGEGGDCAVADHSVVGTVRYASREFGELYRRLYDASGVYIPASETRIDPAGATLQLLVNPVAIAPADENIMFYPSGTAGPVATIWRTTTAESATQASWTDLAIGGVSNPITALAVSEASPSNVLYFGTEQGEIYKIDGADTVLPGVTPTDIFTGKGLPAGAYVSDIAINPLDADRVMVVFSNYDTPSIFHTTDGGATWEDVEGNLKGVEDAVFGFDGPSVRSVALMSGTTAPYVVGTSTGVYSATDLNGASTVWAAEGSITIGNVVVESVRGRRSDQLLLVGTQGAGVFGSTVPLSVELAAFTVATDEAGATVSWTTSSERNGVGFEVQYRSVSEAEFRTAKITDGTGGGRYSARIELDADRYDFRLKSVDAGGAVTYSAVVEAAVETAGEYNLSEAYPNPFSTRAGFALTVKADQNVQVELYDSVGRRVAVLLDETLPGGVRREIEVDGSSLPAGVYLYRVRGERFADGGSIVVVR